MKSLHFYANTLVALSGLWFSSIVSADWQLDNQQSSLNFITTKNINASEIHHFKQLSGELSAQGNLKVDIALDSVETGIAIRNSRMKEKLFAVDKFPAARLTATLPDTVLAMKNGQSAIFDLPAMLKIMSTQQPIKVSVLITRNTDGNYIATSTQPVLISAADFGLQSGVELLQQIAGLSSIGLTVPVSFTLLFAQD